jgi:uncharacterized protein YukE
MAENIEASPQAIIDLTGAIYNDIKKIDALGGELSSQLKTLGSTFRDEGYITIQSYVTKTQQKVHDAIPDLKMVMGKLNDYAELLIKARGFV